jgi:K+-sensing histidine kinase KdpD
MRREVFGLSRLRWLWIPMLPFLFACAGFAAASILKGWGSAGAVLFFALTVLLALVEGALFVLGRPKRRALQTQAVQLQAVYEVLQKAGGSLDLQEVLDSITRLTVEVSGVRGCSIKLLDEAASQETGSAARAAGGKMHVHSLAGIERKISDLSVDTAENIYAKSLLDGRPVLLEDAQASDFPELDEDVESLVCVPLKSGAQEAGARVVGALCLYGEKGKNLPPETLSFLSRLGDLVTISIERASVYEGLKKLDESKTWFLLKASHELKSPLASIQSICQTMLEGYLGDLTDKQRELIERIRLRSSVLQETANDLLVLARLRTRLPGGTRERIRLADAVEEILSFMQHDAERKEIRLALEAGAEPVSVTASKEELRSAIGNLLSNAVKYSPRGSTVTVSLSSTPGGARLSVADQGIGIPVSEREGLFREFFRATNARSFTEAGTGLGLAIVKSIMDSLGGSVDIRSEEGKGTTASIVFHGER